MARQSIAKVQALETQANNLMTTTKDEHIKLAAMDRVRQYAIDIAKLYSEGPFLFSVIKRDGLHTGVQRTAAELRQPSILSADSEPEQPGDETEDRNAVF